MATAVYQTEEITLQDGSTLLLKPLTIKYRRKFMKLFNQLAEAKTEPDEEGNFDAQEDALIKLIPLCVAGQRKDWDGALSHDPEEAEKGMDAIVEVLDDETLAYILKVTTGVDLKAMVEPMMEALRNAEQDGTN